MNDMLQAEKDDKLSDGLSRVVRVPTLLKQLEDLCRKSFDATDGVPAAACWIQLDDVEGHREQIGFSGLDKLMHAIHERVRAQLDPADLSARFGLSAIGVLLHPKDADRDFRATGEALVKAVNNNLFEVGEYMIAATVSIAVRRLHEGARSAELNLVHAAAAAEQTSAAGGNHCDTGDRGSSAEQQSPGSLLGQLTKALRDDSIKVVFQPLLATSGPERERAQLLPRLTAPDGSLIPAARFIPVAAERGVLPALDHWMIARAVALLKRAVEHGGDLPQYFLNQSPALLEDRRFVDWVVEQVEPLERDQRRLVLEFSILDLKPRIREARSVLTKLRELGLAVSLTGIDEKVPETILLKHLPADYLRMNADFARRLVDDGKLAEQFEAFVETARKAGRRMIVPMLEDAEAVSKIWQMNVDLIQGNFIQQPSERLTEG